MTSIPFHLIGMLHHPHPLFKATTQLLHQLINHRLRDYSSSTLNQVKQSHAKLLVNGLQEDNTLFSEALSFYKRDPPSSNSLNYCCQIFNRISNPSVSSWNSVIRIYADDGGNWECLRLYREMRRRGYNPDHLTFPFLLKASAWSGKSSDAAAGIHTHILRYGFASDGFAMTSLMKVYLICGCLESACQLFDEMPHEKDVASWNVLIGGFSERGFSDSATSYFTEMRRSNCGCFPDFITVMNLMQCCCSLEVGKALHGFTLKNGIERDVPVRNTMIAMYARCRANELARSVFREMPADEQTVVSWNALIAGYSYQRNSMEALRVFIIMLISSETKPDLGTMLSLFSSFADSDALLQGERAHAYAVKAGFDSYVPTCNVIMSMYSKCCRPLAAFQVFNEMKERNSISWSTVIDGFSMNGYSDKAKSLFRESDEEPDSAAVVAVLAACSMSSDLEYGTWVHKYATQNSLLLKNIVVCNAILDMYVKCGSMKDAGIVFESMQEKNVVTWTTMISGYAMNGESAQALQWFREMLKTGIRPNRITFLAVLSACSHSGLVKEGLEIFSKMSTVHDVSPHMEHYACVVDLLGRKGRLKEALDFMLRMPENPDSGIWASFLNACKIHHDVEMAEFAAERILELEPDAAAGHVAIASVYAGEGEWDGADRIRRMMRLKGVNKRPGYSMIFK